MKSFLKLPNLSFLFSSEMRDYWGFDATQGGLNTTFEQYGYVSSFIIPNMITIFTLICVFLSLWLIVAIKDLIIKHGEAV